jgi:HD-like signal output (HDOD) protein
MHVLSDNILSTIQLVTLPQVYLKVKEIVEDENSSLNDLAKCIVYDPALSAQLLRMANCALWAPANKIETISRALDVLGMRHVHDLVLATAVSSTFKTIDTPYISLEKFWRKSVFTALACGKLGECCELVDVQRPFVEGLLSDIGHMVLYHAYPEKALRAHELANGDLNTLLQLEREFMGCDYAEVGAMLAYHWRLPACFSEVIGHQHKPFDCPKHAIEASIAHIASCLTYQKFENPSLDFNTVIAPMVWSTLNIEADCLSEVETSADESLSSVLQMVM